MKLRILFLIGVVACGLAIGSSIAWSQQSGERPPITSLGQPVSISSTGASQLRDVEQHAGRRFAIRLLNERAGRAVYRLDGERPCFAVGPAGSGDRGRAFGSIGCSAEFASGEVQMLSFSLFRRTAGNPRPHYVRVEGVVNDAVDVVRVFSSAGEVVMEIPVVNNAFAAEVSVLNAVSLQALSASREVLHEETLPEE